MTELEDWIPLCEMNDLRWPFYLNWSLSTWILLEENAYRLQIGVFGKLEEISRVRTSELEITMKLWLTKSLCKSLRYLVWLGEETWSMKDLTAPLFQESLSLNLRCLSNWDSKLEMKLSLAALNTCSLKNLYSSLKSMDCCTWDFPVNMISAFIPIFISTSVIYLDNLWGISIFCWCRHNDLQMEMN